MSKTKEKPAAADQVAAAAPESKSAPVIVFEGADKRIKPVDLQWPLTIDGVTYRQIFLRRLAAGEVAAFIDKITAAGVVADDAKVRFPIYIDVAGNAIPEMVIAALDDDDAFALDEAARDFLPRRFRPTS
jgi:hypothetical protein